MKHEKRIGLGRIATGLVVMGIGLYFLLDNLHVIPADFTLHHWWPVILIILGLVNLFNSRDIFCFSGWVLVSLGVIFLMVTTGHVSWGEVWKFWPVVLIILGLSLIFQRRVHWADREGRKQDPRGEALIREHCILNGISLENSSPEFKGGDLSAVLGSIEIDLRRAKMAPQGATLTLSATLGSIEIRMPTEWELEINSSSVLGSIEDKTHQKPQMPGNKMIIKASAVLGSIELTN